MMRRKEASQSRLPVFLWDYECIVFTWNIFFPSHIQKSYFPQKHIDCIIQQPLWREPSIIDHSWNLSWELCRTNYLVKEKWGKIQNRKIDMSLIACHMGREHASREKKLTMVNFLIFVQKNVSTIRFQEIKIRPLKGFEKMKKTPEIPPKRSLQLPLIDLSPFLHFLKTL